KANGRCATQEQSHADGDHGELPSCQSPMESLLPVNGVIHGLIVHYLRREHRNPLISTALEIGCPSLGNCLFWRSCSGSRSDRFPAVIFRRLPKPSLLERLTSHGRRRRRVRSPVAAPEVSVLTPV